MRSLIAYTDVGPLCISLIYKLDGLIILYIFSAFLLHTLAGNPSSTTYRPIKRDSPQAYDLKRHAMTQKEQGL